MKFCRQCPRMLKACRGTIRWSLPLCQSFALLRQAFIKTSRCLDFMKYVQHEVQRLKFSSKNRAHTRAQLEEVAQAEHKNSRYRVLRRLKVG